MKYCKKCHILYSDAAGACPKCGVVTPNNDASDEPATPVDKRAVKRDWLWLAVGIPLFIGVICLMIYLLKLS